MPVPSANDFRKMVKRNPGEPNLGDGTAATPLMTEGKTIDVVVAMGISTPGPLGKGDEFKVTNLDDGSPYAGGICIKGKRLSTELYLEDGNGKCLAKIYKKGGKMGAHCSYEICAPAKFAKHQKVSPNTDPDGNYLHCWAKVGGDDFGDLKLKVEMYSDARGGEFVETYVSEPHLPEGGYMALKGKPPISFIRKDGSHVAFLSEQKVENALKGPAWKVHIAPGMDPLLIICFTAILDEYGKKKLKA